MGRSRVFSDARVESLRPLNVCEAKASWLAIGILDGFLLVAFYTEAIGQQPCWLSFWFRIGRIWEKALWPLFLRVSVALAITLIWTIPVGVFIGTNRRLAAILQPIVQSGCIHSGDGAFPGDVAGIAASAGRVKYRRCAPDADGDTVVSAFQCDCGSVS